MNKKIVLYSTGCTMCRALKQRLDEAKIEYQVEDDIDKMMSLGFTTVPMLQVDDKILTYKEAISYINEYNKQ